VNWLKTAISAEQAPTGDNPGGQQTVQPTQTATQGAQESAQVPEQGQSKISPSPTPTPAQAAAQGKQQRREQDQVFQVAIPQAAQASIASLNQGLKSLISNLMSKDELGLTEDAAKALAVEIAAEWIGASRKGVVTRLDDVVVKSTRLPEAISRLIYGR